MQGNTPAQISVLVDEETHTQTATRTEWKKNLTAQEMGQEMPSRLSYDSEADALSISLHDGTAVSSNEVEPGIILNYDKEGNIVGVAVLHASRRLKLPTREAA